MQDLRSAVIRRGNEFSMVAVAAQICVDLRSTPAVLDSRSPSIASRIYSRTLRSDEAMREKLEIPSSESTAQHATCLSRLGTERTHLGQPPFACGAATCLDQTEQTGFDWANAAETEDVTLQALQAMSTEIPAIYECRHTHCDYDAGTLSLEELFPRLAALGLRDGKSRAEDLL